jgi:DNA-binding XRE family transcriptional regulator
MALLTASVTETVTGFLPRVILFILFNAALLAGLIYLFVLLIKALRKYLKSGEVRKEKAAACQSLGEALKEHRVRCHMTQEFVAEHLGVSRQAVSKWENGTSDPSTGNLLALAKLYDISAEELLKNVQ